jgi:hypothetical protein
MTTTTLHIENTVHDFESWKQVFDKFDRFRADHGVRSYRVARRTDDDHQIVIDLDFGAAIEKIWRTPQSQQQLARHGAPTTFEVVEQRTF